jgi:hypothetical protein
VVSKDVLERVGDKWSVCIISLLGGTGCEPSAGLCPGGAGLKIVITAASMTNP